MVLVQETAGVGGAWAKDLSRPAWLVGFFHDRGGLRDILSVARWGFDGPVFGNRHPATTTASSCFAPTAGLETTARLTRAGSFASAGRLVLDSATAFAFASTSWIHKAFIATTAARTRWRETAIGAAHFGRLTAASVSPEVCEPAENASAFATALPVMVAACVAGIDTVGWVVDPRINVQLAATAALIAAATRSRLATSVTRYRGHARPAATGAHGTHATGQSD